MANIKHVGKLTSGQKVIILFRTVPNEDQHCLITETANLPQLYHDRLMELVESDEGQQAPELADLLSRRFFPDGENVLNSLHRKGFIKKMQTKNVMLTPNSQTTVPLNEVNAILSAQSNAKSAKTSVQQVMESVQSEPVAVTQAPTNGVLDDAALAKSLLAQAASYEKEAAALRAQAEALVPNVKISKKRGRSAKAG